MRRFISTFVASATSTEGNCDICFAPQGRRCNPFKHGLFLSGTYHGWMVRNLIVRYTVCAIKGHKSTVVQNVCYRCALGV